MKRFLFFIFTISLFLIALPKNPVHAQDTWKFASPESFGSALEGEDNNAQASWFTGLQYSSYGLTCQIGGYACDSNVLSDNFFQKSALGFTSNAIALTFLNKPADFGLWLADTAHTLGFAPKPVYAQGVGFSGLLPLLPIWKVFRNVAYLLMAVVMVAIGFMIMFRKKIDPKTVVTAQNAIPRVIISLILITFSYAIVGFVIDLMYVLIALVVTLFKSTTYLQGGADVTAVNHLWNALFNTEFNPFRILLGRNVDTATAGWAVGLTAAITGVAGFFNMGGLWIITVLSAIVPLLFYVALLFLYIKLFVFFVGTYIQIILSLIVSPLQLLFESFPGSNAFSSWFKNLIANVSVFPVAAAIFMLSNVFQEISKSQVASGAVDTTKIWAPPYIGMSTSTTAVASIISLGLLWAIPQVCGSIKEALKAKPILGAGGGGGGGGLQSGMQMVSTLFYLQQLTPKKFRERLFGGGGEGHAQGQSG